VNRTFHFSLLILPVFLWCKAPAIFHAPPRDLMENTPFLVEVIADAKFPPPNHIMVYYRNATSEHYQELITGAEGYVFRGVIPVEAISGDSLRYFIVGDFGKLGMVGLPGSEDPRQHPYSIKIRNLAELIQNGGKLSIKQDSQVKGNIRFLEKPEVSVVVKNTPWRVISTRHRPQNIPKYYQVLPDSAVECGMVQVRGNIYTGYVELYAAILNHVREERADGFTQLRYNAYTQRDESGTMSSLPFMEAIYFSFGPTHQY